MLDSQSPIYVVKHAKLQFYRLIKRLHRTRAATPAGHQDTFLCIMIQYFSNYCGIGFGRFFS
jgi:hypothetical protein